MDNKIILRNNFLKTRQNLSNDFVNKSSLSINLKFQKLIQLLKPNIIAGYQAINNEVIIDLKLIETKLKYLVGNNKNNFDKWYLASNLDKFQNWIEIKDKINLIIIPLVAFNSFGDRIGYGRGNYDKWLKDFHGIKVGFAYEIQKTDKLFACNHDIKLDYIITEKKIYKFI